MQKNSTTTAQVNKVRITFTKRKMTAYGGFALIASFFEQIGFAGMIEKAMPIEECSPNGMGIYGKTIAFIAMVYAGAERFSHLIYLGNKEVLARMFGVKRLPDAATTLTRMFNKLKSIKAADILSRNVWAYLSQLIPWDTIQEDWLTFDSSVLPRYGEQEGARKGYNPAKHGRPSHSPLLAFLNRSKYVIHLWNLIRQRHLLEQYPCLLCSLLWAYSGPHQGSGHHRRQWVLPETVRRDTRKRTPHVHHRSEVHKTPPATDLLAYRLEGDRQGSRRVRVFFHASRMGKGETVHRGAAGYHAEEEGYGKDTPSLRQRSCCQRLSL
jgi:hypothetical protein